jgi:uncharacterized membrane protein
MALTPTRRSRVFLIAAAAFAGAAVGFLISGNELLLVVCAVLSVALYVIGSRRGS